MGNLKNAYWLQGSSLGAAFFVGTLFLLLSLPGCATKNKVPLPHQQPLHAQAQKPSRQELLNKAYHEWAGVPHRDGGYSKNGVDCSGFVQIIFRQLFNKELPRTTTALAQTGTAIAKNQLKPGDIILFKISSKGKHVGIYVGDNQFIHASKSKGVWRSDFNLPYWQNHYWQSRRVLN